MPSGATCGLSNGTITISASGTGNLLYSIDNGVSWSNDSVFLNLAPGNYSVSVKNDYCETKFQQNPQLLL
ncbi:MAG: hypothetical protein IPH88_01620 [Bacteroidales bacterium]|nr:hypothetical protein [Bacteroidales bacterium]